MLQISRKQVLERWDTLLDNLKEALFSEFNADIVWQIGSLNHLPEEKISLLATIVGDVIFGFLHPDDLAREIQESLNLNPQIANSISREINRKIFAPLRIDLEKIYNPVRAMPEIKPPTKPEPEAKIEKEMEPKPLEIKPEVEIKPELEPKPAPLPTTPTIPPAPTPSVPPTPIPAEKPFILQQEAEIKPVSKKGKTPFPVIGWFKKEKTKKIETPIKVELETLGLKTEEKKEPIIAKTEAPTQKVIHYREVEMPTPFGKPSGETPPIKVEPLKPEAQIPEVQIPKGEELPKAEPFAEPPKPFDETQGKPEEPKVISLDSFEVIKGKNNKSNS